MPGVGHSAELEVPGKTVALIEQFAEDAPPPVDITDVKKKLKPIPGIKEQLETAGKGKNGDEKADNGSGKPKPKADSKQTGKSG